MVCQTLPRETKLSQTLTDSLHMTNSDINTYQIRYCIVLQLKRVYFRTSPAAAFVSFLFLRIKRRTFFCKVKVQQRAAFTIAYHNICERSAFHMQGMSDSFFLFVCACQLYLQKSWSKQDYLDHLHVSSPRRAQGTVFLAVTLHRQRRPNYPILHSSWSLIASFLG